MPNESSETSAEMRNGLLDETKAAIETLIENPKTPFDCIFEDGPAVTIMEMEQGCVTRSEKLQTLCPQHTLSANPMGDCIYVVDLSLDAGWTLRYYKGSEPLYVIDTEQGLLPWDEWVMTETYAKNSANNGFSGPLL